VGKPQHEVPPVLDINPGIISLNIPQNDYSKQPASATLKEEPAAR
jgi:hypothetical protein